MSIKEQFKKTELTKIRKWYAHSCIWGYDTNTGDDRNFEQDAHGLQHYYALTSMSDLVFRNAVRLKTGNKCIFSTDVWQKARQMNNVLLYMREICRVGNPVFKLLEDYFENADPDFVEEIADMKVTARMSAPFEVLVRAAKALFGIVYESEAFVREHVLAIQALEKWYHNEGGRQEIAADIASAAVKPAKATTRRAAAAARVQTRSRTAAATAAARRR
jgi:hypothetical protein